MYLSVLINMSTLHRKLPQIINLVDEVDTIILDQIEVRDGRTSSSGEFIMCDGVVGDNRIVRVTPRDEGRHLDAHMIIMDDKENILLEGVHIKQECFRKVFNIYSPAGFILGRVRERCLKSKAYYEILSGNQEFLFLLIHENNETESIIKITESKARKVIAKVTLSLTQDGKCMYTITYVKKIQVLYKLQILCAVLLNTQQDPSKHTLCCMIKNKLDTVRCFPLYYDNNPRSVFSKKEDKELKSISTVQTLT
ncbi:unnamed protein product [Mytilus coruscus]|uniref:Uncharacterized protein n=1 Tax=Mytilus coruscus TaxID=42192 RepID=A0A6J8EVJ9_MYTCO|nr:unnamed protein product [Mytilus coruscus]